MLDAAALPAAFAGPVVIALQSDVPGAAVLPFALAFALQPDELDVARLLSPFVALAAAAIQPGVLHAGALPPHISPEMYDHDSMTVDFVWLGSLV